MSVNTEREAAYSDFIDRVNDLCTEYGFIIDVNRATGRGRLVVIDAATNTEMTHEYHPVRFEPKEQPDGKTREMDPKEGH